MPKPPPSPKRKDRKHGRRFVVIVCLLFAILSYEFAIEMFGSSKEYSLKSISSTVTATDIQSNATTAGARATNATSTTTTIVGIQAGVSTNRTATAEATTTTTPKSPSSSPSDVVIAAGGVKQSRNKMNTIPSPDNSDSKNTNSSLSSNSPSHLNQSSSASLVATNQNDTKTYTDFTSTNTTIRIESSVSASAEALSGPSSSSLAATEADAAKTTKSTAAITTKNTTNRIESSVSASAAGASAAQPLGPSSSSSATTNTTSPTNVTSPSSSISTATTTTTTTSTLSSDSKSQHDSYPTITIYVHLSGELGNYLSTWVHAKGIQYYLLDHYNIQSKLIFFHQITRRKRISGKTRPTLFKIKSCFPKLYQDLVDANYTFTEDAYQPYVNANKQQKEWFEKLRQSHKNNNNNNNSSSINFPLLLDSLPKLNEIENPSIDVVPNAMSTFVQLLEMRLQEEQQNEETMTTSISVPYLDASSLRFSEYWMDTYYEQMKEYFQFNHSNPVCCQQDPQSQLPLSPYPNETVLVSTIIYIYCVWVWVCAFMY